MIEVKPAAVPMNRAARNSACGCSIFGFCLLAAGLALSWPALRASTWPTASGTVLESRIKPAHTKKGPTTNACQVTYWFVVNGTRYTGDKLDALPVSTSGNAPFEDQARFPPGAPCVVHYNPADPNDSCLRPDPPTAAWIMIAMGVFCWLAAASTWGRAWWRKSAG